MSKLEVFFDYACPFCLKGHKNLIELLPEFPQLEIIWKPCESHPRPEQYGTHSDLCIQGMFFAADKGVDLWVYHERMYDLMLNRRINVEDIDILTANVGDILDAGAFREAIENGKYEQRLDEANDYAYEQSGVWFVPAYRMDGRKLDSAGGTGVTKTQLRAFWETSL